MRSARRHTERVTHPLLTSKRRNASVPPSEAVTIYIEIVGLIFSWPSAVDGESRPVCRHSLEAIGMATTGALATTSKNTESQTILRTPQSVDPFKMTTIDAARSRD